MTMTMTVWALIIVAAGGVYVPSSSTGVGDAEFRYHHECVALAKDWQRFGFQAICVERSEEKSK